VSHNATQAVEFRQVLETELKQIEQRRLRRELGDPPPDADPPPDDEDFARRRWEDDGGSVWFEPPMPSLQEVQEKARAFRLVGLAFSGGGIRSATFNLGFLQGLAGVGLLKRFDYLSTVSGGSYIGAWLAAWMQRRGAESVEEGLRPEKVRQSAATDSNRLDPIRHLRRHSNYLAPRQGFLSIDRVVLWAIYLRNFLLNQLVLFPTAMIVLLVSRLVMFLYYPTVNEYGFIYGDPYGRIPRHPIWNNLCVALAVVGGAVGLFLAIAAVHKVRRGEMQPGTAKPKKPKWLLLGVVLPISLYAVFFCSLASYPFPLSELSSILNKQIPPPPPQEMPQVVGNTVGLLAGSPLGSGPLLAASTLIPKGWWLADLAIFMMLSAVVIGLCYGIGNRSLVVWILLALCFHFFPGGFAGTGWLLDQAVLMLFLVILIGLSYGKIWQSIVVVPLLLSLFIFFPRGYQWSWWLADLAAFMVFPAGLIGFFYVITSHSQWKRPILGWCLLIGLAWGAMLYGAYCLILGFFAWDGSEPLQPMQIAATAQMTTFGPPLLILNVVLAIFLGVGLLREHLGEGLREWFASLCAWLLTAALGWAAVNLLALYGTALVLWAGPWVRTALASGWLLTVAAGIFAGSSERTGPQPTKNPFRDLAARVAFPVFSVGIFTFISLMVHAAVDKPPTFGLSDEANVPYLYEPEHPPTRVSVMRTGQRGEVKVQRKKEYLRILNEAAAAQQRYWLGMVNTGEGVWPVNIYLTDGDTKFLETYGVPKEILDKLVTLQYEDPSEPNQYRIWKTEEFQDNLDRLFPEAWNLQWRRLILQRARGAGTGVAFEKDKFLRKIGTWLFGCVALLVLASWRVDVNAFSLHGMYLNRLVRAYLGASRQTGEQGSRVNPTQKDPKATENTRLPDPVTLFDPNDDLSLAELNFNRVNYDGPFLIVNAALNLVHTKELAWQDRKAESFMLTPAYCGSEETGYRPTDAGADKYAGGVNLGTAVAISGAAASPNMGYHSSPSVTFLLTVFNARLGAWLGNPFHDKHWMDPGPNNGFWHLFKELFGWTDETGPYVFLSDGGHFENLGVYELVKRRCQYVVVCDAGQDPEHAFEDLGNLIRKVRIDFGIRIDIAFDFLSLQKEPRHSRWHCAIGKIRYDDVDREAIPGTLIYVKSSLTGDEPADVLQYAASHPTFPHETTANQFYTESQFESYRALGQHIAEAIFEHSVVDAKERSLPSQQGAGKLHRLWCRELFASLVRRWFAMPPEYDEKFVESTHGYTEVQTAFRNDPRLWLLTLEIYPELDVAGALAGSAAFETGPELAARRGAELRVLAQMLQVMENAYLSLNLEANYSHPMNRGWMDVYHRWTGAPTFRTHWTLLRSEFGLDFVRFCEKQMHLGDVTAKVEDLEGISALSRILLEFRAERGNTRGDWLLNELYWTFSGNSRAWTVSPDNTYPLKIWAEGARAPAGLILICPDMPKHPKDYLLFIWLRGAYRNTGLGRSALLQLFLEKLNDWPPRPFRLRVRLPIAGLTGPGGKLQKGMWLTFFHQLDFVQSRPVAEDEKELELHRDFH